MRKKLYKLEAAIAFNYQYNLPDYIIGMPKILEIDLGINETQISIILIR